MSKPNIEVVNMIKRFLMEAEYRSYPNKALRAAAFLYNYMGDEIFTQNNLAEAANCRRSEIEKALWKLLMGYNELIKNNTLYLAPIYEEDLATTVQEACDNHSPMTKDEIIKKVILFISKYRLTLLNVKSLKDLIKL